MKKFDWVKALGLLCTVGGIVISVVNNIVEDKKMDAKIEEAVQAKLTELNFLLPRRWSPKGWEKEED